MANIKNVFERRRRRDSYRYSNTDKPVLGVFRSSKHMSIYVSQDKKVLFSIGTVSKELPSELKNKNNIETSQWLGNVMAGKLKSMNIDSVVFNKSGYKFHGRIAEVAKVIRESGIKC